MELLHEYNKGECIVVAHGHSAASSFHVACGIAVQVYYDPPVAKMAVNALGKKRLTMQFDCAVAGVSGVVLMDSGAEELSSQTQWGVCEESWHQGAAAWDIKQACFAWWLWGACLRQGPHQGKHSEVLWSCTKLNSNSAQTRSYTRTEAERKSQAQVLSLAQEYIENTSMHTWVSRCIHMGRACWTPSTGPNWWRFWLQ